MLSVATAGHWNRLDRKGDWLIMKQIMSVDYDPGPSKEINISLDKWTKRKLKRKAEIEEYAKFGVRMLKLQAKTSALVGKYADRLGIKHVGYGKILSASDHAESTIDELDSIIEELRKQEPPAESSTIAVFMQLKRDFTRLLMESGEAHINASNQAQADKKAGIIQLPFPIGQPMAVVMGQTKPEIPQQIEPPKSSE